MLRKFSKYPTYILPLLAHTAIHGFATFLIALVFRPHQLLGAALLGLFDTLIHFTMDRIKASPDLLGQYKALSGNEMKNILSYVPTLGEQGVKDRFGKDLKSNTLFWWALGLDQMVHHLTHYIIIWELLK